MVLEQNIRKYVIVNDSGEYFDKLTAGPPYAPAFPNIYFVNSVSAAAKLATENIAIQWAKLLHILTPNVTYKVVLHTTNITQNLIYTALSSKEAIVPNS